MGFDQFLHASLLSTDSKAPDMKPFISLDEVHHWQKSYTTMEPCIQGENKINIFLI